jgi:hypothetical protein
MKKQDNMAPGSSYFFSGWFKDIEIVEIPRIKSLVCKMISEREIQDGD